LEGDRDTRLRVELAERHLQEARRALEGRGSEEEGGAEAQRREALRQARRALTLHPASEETAEFIASWLLTPPTDVPAEVEHETGVLQTRW